MRRLIIYALNWMTEWQCQMVCMQQHIECFNSGQTNRNSRNAQNNIKTLYIRTQRNANGLSMCNWKCVDFSKKAIWRMAETMWNRAQAFIRMAGSARRIGISLSFNRMIFSVRYLWKLNQHVHRRKKNPRNTCIRETRHRIKWRQTSCGSRVIIFSSMGKSWRGERVYIRTHCVAV